MQDFPIAPEDLDATWLGNAVGREVTSLRSEPVRGGFWSRIVRTELIGPGCTPGESIVAKFANPSDQARFVCSTFEFPRVEIEFYRGLADATQARSPRCHLAVADADCRDYVIVMEDLGHLRQLNQLAGCPLEEAGAVVDALARMHAGWWDDEHLATLPWLRTPDDEQVAERLGLVLSMVWEVAFANLDAIPDEIDTAWPTLLTEIPGLLGRLSHEPHTLAHGDVRLTNLFFSADTDPPGVGFVDWQAARRAHGCYDLAYFLTQSLTTEAHREHHDHLLRRYQSALGAEGVQAPTLDELRTAYRLCSLYCLVYPILASSAATSGADAEALEIATRAFTAVLDLDALSML